MVLSLALLIVAATAAAQPPQGAEATPAAMQIFEQDWVLMNWPLKFYDTNRDILLQRDEAQAAADAFRKLADANNDGRVTTDEYRTAREFILARY